MSNQKMKDEKVQTVERYLSMGMNRSEIALKLGYGSWRSLDIFMRRSGMRWNGTLNKYLSEEELFSEKSESIRDPLVATEKVMKIIRLFKEDEADPRNVAKLTGFKDHLEMASYMSAKGFVWSCDSGNYVKSTTRSRGKFQPPDNKPVPCSESDNVFQNSAMINDRYAHLLEILTKNEDRLLELLLPETYSRTIPRYFVPGITRTKSFYMSDPLSKLLNEFCQSKNLSQKEVVEAAIVEFLSKYSFKKEVDALIRGE